MATHHIYGFSEVLVSCSLQLHINIGNTKLIMRIHYWEKHNAVRWGRNVWYDIHIIQEHVCVCVYIMTAFGFLTPFLVMLLPRNFTESSNIPILCLWIPCKTTFMFAQVTYHYRLQNIDTINPLPVKAGSVQVRQKWAMWSSSFIGRTVFCDRCENYDHNITRW